jgi:hypothetical protein
MVRPVNLQRAASDLRYLLERNYPRKAALVLVGNRYQLRSDQRHLLHRGVFSGADSAFRRQRKVPIAAVKGEDLAIDGYNVVITIEAGLAGHPLILADDGFVRDISGVSRNFRKSPRTEQTLQWICETLKKIKPRRVLLLFDAPISKSGRLAEEVRAQLKETGIRGDALAIAVPEHVLIGFPGIVATSDTAIIDRSRRVVDLAGLIIRRKIPSTSILRLRGKEK